jgi:lipid II:glycine glycyltransferase (peptidoglycan interpeptide bridge formation enzyme)
MRRGLLLRVIPHAFQQDPHGAAMTAALARLGFAEDTQARRYNTIRVNLNSTADVLRAQLSSRWRRQLNIAERNGLEIVEGKSDDLFGQFVRLYKEMMARKRFETTVDINEFERIQRRLPQAQRMTTFLCLVGGSPRAGLVVDSVGKTAIYLLAATGDEGLNARGSYLLQWRAMQRLKEHGCEWYDLGGVNQEVNPGVFTFKSGMGGEAACHLGRYSRDGSWLSAVSVSAGESLSRFSQKLAAITPRPAAPLPSDASE